MSISDVAIATGNPSKMMNSSSLCPKGLNMPCENSATRKADRPMIRRIAMRMTMIKVRTRLSSASSFLEALGRKRSVGQMTPMKRTKNTVNEMTCRVNPPMMMPWPVLTPPSRRGVSLIERPPPEDWIKRAKMSPGINMRAYNLGLMLKTPLPR